MKKVVDGDEGRSLRRDLIDVQGVVAAASVRKRYARQRQSHSLVSNVFREPVEQCVEDSMFFLFVPLLPSHRHDCTFNRSYVTNHE